MTEKEKQLQEKLQVLLSVMTDSEADRLLAYAEGMYAAVALAAQPGA